MRSIDQIVDDAVNNVIDVLEAKHATSLDDDQWQKLRELMWDDFEGAAKDAERVVVGWGQTS